MKNLGFLASTWASPDMKSLRFDIHQLGIVLGRNIWVAECDAPDLKPERGYDPLTIVDRCLDEIELSERFILLLDNNAGSSVALEGQMSDSTYIELEFFQAIMHEKPIHIIIVGNISDDSPCARLLNLLTYGVNCDIRRAKEHDDALKAVEDIIKRDQLCPWLLRDKNKRFFTGRLALTRHHDFANKNLFQEIQFLQGRSFIVGKVCPDLDLVEALLESAKLQQHSNRKMSRAWLALRSLMHHHYADTDDLRALGLWEEALRIWSKFAAWRGFHAHLWLGHIAALGSLKEVIERQGRSIADIGGTEHSDNLGAAFASVYYSLSKIAPNRHSSSFLNRSALYVDHGIATTNERHQSGLFAIRGSINMRRGYNQNAVRDYEKAIQIAERFHHSDRSLGGLLAELGWAEFWRGDLTNGKAHMEEGVRLMDASSAGPGFRARGKRKLAAAQFLTFSVSNSYMTAQSASSLIQEFGLYDQRDILIRTTDRLGGFFNWTRGSE